MRTIKSIALLVTIGATIIFNSCKFQEDKTNQIHYTRQDFKKQKTLSNPEIITLPEVLNPASLYLIQDSIIVIQNQPDCDYLLEIYSINNLTSPLIQLAPKGNGPEDMLSCYCYIHTNTQPEFYLEDGHKNHYYTVNIDSILKNKKLSLSAAFKYNPNKHPSSEICSLDKSHYITYNMWYLDSSQFNNNVPKLEISSTNETERRIEMGEKPYFVGAVNGAHLFKNPKTHDIWSADIHQDKIDIYDDSLNLKRVLYGPDHFQPKYVRKESNAPIAFIGFDYNKEYKTYSNFFITDKHIYLIYEGNENYNPDHLEPVEIFKLDFDGNLLCNYKLDRYLYTISIDKAEKYLYGSSRNAIQDETFFVRYKL